MYYIIIIILLPHCGYNNGYLLSTEKITCNDIEKSFVDTNNTYYIMCMHDIVHYYTHCHYNYI